VIGEIISTSYLCGWRPVPVIVTLLILSVPLIDAQEIVRHDNPEEIAVVLPGEIISARKKIFNELGKDARIIDVEKSCSCTELAFSSYLLGPKESADVDVLIQAPKNLGPGSISVNYRLVTDEHSEGKNFKIKYLVSDLLSIATLGPVILDAASSSARVVLNKGANKTKWDRAEFIQKPTNFGINCSLEAGDQMQAWSLNVRSDSMSDHVGYTRLLGSIRYYDNGIKLKHETAISLTVVKRASISAFPPMLLLGSVAEDSVKHGEVTIKSDRGKVGIIDKIYSGDEKQVKINSIAQNDESAKIELMFTSSGLVGNQSGEIMISVGTTILHIPYIVMVMDSKKK
jgi:hypothetical protein